ncbi:hypothetical protein AB0N76_35720, partial [Kitasatospora sp. NPDC093806]
MGDDVAKSVDADGQVGGGLAVDGNANGKANGSGKRKAGGGTNGSPRPRRARAGRAAAAAPDPLYEPAPWLIVRTPLLPARGPGAPAPAHPRVGEAAAR